jgi:hypothetical protein
MTFRPSTERLGADLLTWCLAASRARTSPPLEKVPDSTANEAASGLKCLGSLARFDLDTRLWKTHQFSLLGGLESFSETWPRWGMMRDGECWELSPPEHLTSGNESGSWRTPTVGMLNADRAKDPEYGQRKLAKGQTITLADQVKDSRMWPTPKANEPGMTAKTTGRGVEKSTHLTTQVALAEGMIDPTTGRLWPTPTVCGNYNRKGASKNSGDGLASVVRRYPTPGANEDSYRLNGNSQQSNSLGAIARREALAESPESGGQLNPTWVEWLMGWPLGWTDCAASATDKFRQWCRSHGIS